MSARIRVRVQPGAKRAGLTGRLASGEWKLMVTAPPEDGRANEAVVALLAERLGLRRRDVVIERGATSKSKWIVLETLTDEDAEQRLRAALDAASA